MACCQVETCFKADVGYKRQVYKQHLQVINSFGDAPAVTLQGCSALVQGHTVHRLLHLMTKTQSFWGASCSTFYCTYTPKLTTIISYMNRWFWSMLRQITFLTCLMLWSCCCEVDPTDCPLLLLLWEEFGLAASGCLCIIGLTAAMLTAPYLTVPLHIENITQVHLKEAFWQV